LYKRGWNGDGNEFCGDGWGWIQNLLGRLEMGVISVPVQAPSLYLLYVFTALFAVHTMVFTALFIYN